MERIDIEQIKQDFYKMKKIKFKRDEVFRPPAGPGGPGARSGAGSARCASTLS